MFSSRKLTSLSLIAAMLLLVSACVSKVTKQDQYSGFLEDYSQLTKVKLADGVPTLRWVNPELKGRNYTSVYIDPIIVYPAPINEAQVDAKTVKDAAAYLEQQFRTQLKGVITVVDEPMPNTARFRAAITGVETPAENLKAYEYIPIALIVAGVSTAAGGRDRYVDTYLEVELTDINTNEVLARAVKKGVAPTTLENKKAKVTLDDVKPTLDQWAQDGVNATKAFLVK